jgi:hypothetical protein
LARAGEKSASRAVARNSTVKSGRVRFPRVIVLLTKSKVVWNRISSESLFCHEDKCADRPYLSGAITKVSQKPAAPIQRHVNLLRNLYNCPRLGVPALRS